jgi:NUMOD1 domain
MVSNIGRIKRLEYETIYKNGAVIIKKEMILKPEVQYHYNRYKNDYSPCLHASPVLAGCRYNFSVARLVYCTFKNDLEYYDPGYVIFFKNKDPFDILPSNLYAATISEKQKRMKVLGRSPNPFHKLSPAEVKERHWNMVKHKLKKIIQYDLKGRKIRKYNSIADAHRITGCNSTGISRTAKGYHKTCGGYKWKYK